MRFCIKHLWVKTDGKQTEGWPRAEQCWAERLASETSPLSLWEDGATVLPLGATGFKHTLPFRIQELCNQRQILCAHNQSRLCLHVCLTKFFRTSNNVLHDRRSQSHATVSDQQNVNRVETPLTICVRNRVQDKMWSYLYHPTVKSKDQWVGPGRPWDSEVVILTNSKFWFQEVHPERSKVRAPSSKGFQEHYRPNTCSGQQSSLETLEAAASARHQQVIQENKVVKDQTAPNFHEGCVFKEINGMEPAAGLMKHRFAKWDETRRQETV